MQPPSSATPEFLESIGIEPTRFCNWRQMFTTCDNATSADVNTWSGVFRTYLDHYLWDLRHATQHNGDTSEDRDAEIWYLTTFGGLTSDAVEEILEYRERMFGSFACPELLASQVAVPYIENKLYKYET